MKHKVIADISRYKVLNLKIPIQKDWNSIYPISKMNLFIIHASKAVDYFRTAEPALQKIIDILPNSQAIAEQYFDAKITSGSKIIEGSYAKHSGEVFYSPFDNDYVNFSQKASYSIFCGGFYDCCHFTYLAQYLSYRLAQKSLSVIHLPLDAIYLNTQSSPSRFYTSNYFNFLINPYKYGARYMQADISSSLKSDTEIPFAIFKNGNITHLNTEDPKVILNIWGSTDIMIHNYLKKAENE